jgi:hypothetical protein
MTLVSHLRNHLVAFLGLYQRAALPDVMRERLLRINMDTSFHGCHRGRKVRMVWSRNNNRIDLLMHLIEHDTKVIEERLVLPPIFHVLGAMVSIHITKRDKVLFRASLVIRLLRDPSTGAYESDVQFAIG